MSAKKRTGARLADQRRVVEPPPTQVGEARGVFSTQLEKMVAWARSGSLWPLPFGTACCAIEFMSVVSSHYDLARFGAEVVRFSPRQSDMLIVAGTIVDKQAPVLKLIYAILKLQEKIERGEPSRYQEVLLEHRAAEPERHVLAET